MMVSKSFGPGAGLIWLLGAVTMVQGQDASAKRPAYLETPARPVTDTYHGTEIVDPYRWLEDVNDPDVRAWADAQTRLTRSVLDADPTGRSSSRRSGRSTTTRPPASRPSAARAYFFTRREGLKNQPIIYVREGTHDAEPHVLLDPNTFSADGTVALDWMFPSQDGALLAYGVSPDGSEMSTLKVLDVATGKHLPDEISRTRACTMAWEPSGRAFWYVHYPAHGTVPPATRCTTARSTATPSATIPATTR